MASGCVLFETTESVFEILWDIALAVFIVRLAIIYALLAFTLSTLLSYLSFANVLPTDGVGLLVLHVLLAMACARFFVNYHGIPRTGGFRLAIGALGALVVTGVDLLAAGFLYEIGESKLITWWRGNAGAVLLTIALAPFLLMLCEGHPSELHDAAHGHGRKTVTEAM